MAAKKRLTMFDAMDGALSRLGDLSTAAEKAKKLPPLETIPAAVVPQPEAPHGQSEQTNRADKPDTQTEQINRTDKSSRQRADAADVPLRLETRQALSTRAQKRIADYFVKTGSQVTTYRVIATKTDVPYGTVRRVVDRLVGLGWLTKEAWGQGRQRALKFLVLPSLAQGLTATRTHKMSRQIGQTK